MKVMMGFPITGYQKFVGEKVQEFLRKGGERRRLKINTKIFVILEKEPSHPE